MAFRAKWNFRKPGNSTLSSLVNNHNNQADLAEFEKEYQAFIEKLSKENTAEDKAVENDVVETVADKEANIDKDVKVEVCEEVTTATETDVVDETVISKKKKKNKLSR